ncbi:FecR family protein [Massilibacteroides sp.]|uniref:FecR family protein n=1 Tax=Massilibacteroides sp. TaxID=2034766 RepID=UPI00261B2CB6|nr:FecR family protein [Massilibacteroides sp.]MDD4515883.1 FecR family protein [Massilibacteroides sp.]
MRNHERIKQLIGLYFGKKFSLNTCILFGRWLIAEDGKVPKSKVLEEIWRQTSTKSTKETSRDWMELQNRIKPKPSVLHSLRWIKYAAAIGLIITIGATIWITGRTPVSPTIKMAEIFVPYGDSQSIILPDSSEIMLNAGSLLVYPVSFENSLSRTVYLTGEASFSVRKNPEKPFIVETNHMSVRVLGTIFTVKSYPGDTCTTATLEEGSVLVKVKETDIEAVILKPEQQLVYSHKSNSINIMNIDIELFQLKKTGYLIFENSSFNELMIALERKFNVTIQYNSQKHAGDYYNIKFSPEESLEDALRVLEQLIGIHFKIDKKTVIIN